MDEGLRMQFLPHELIPSFEGFKIVLGMSSAVGMQQVCTKQLVEMTALMIAGFSSITLMISSSDT